MVETKVLSEVLRKGVKMSIRHSKSLKWIGCCIDEVLEDGMIVVNTGMNRLLEDRNIVPCESVKCKIYHVENKLEYIISATIENVDENIPYTMTLKVEDTQSQVFKRESRRFDVTLNGIVKSLYNISFGVLVTVINISRSGAAFMAFEELPFHCCENTDICLDIYLTDERAVYLEGIIVWERSSQDGRVFGVKFNCSDQESMSILDDYLKEQEMNADFGIAIARY